MYQQHVQTFSQQPAAVPQVIKPLRKKLKTACVNCKAAKVACNAERPCVWCIRHEMQDSCVDAPKKERKRKRTESSPVEQQTTTTTSNKTTITAPQPHDLQIQHQHQHSTLILTPQPITDISFHPMHEFDFAQELDPFPQTQNFVELLMNASNDSPLPSSPSPPASPTTELLNSLTHDSHLPLLYSPQDNSSSDYSELVSEQIKNAQASMEMAQLLSSLQVQGHTHFPYCKMLPPSMIITECNDQFATLLEYSSAQEIYQSKVTLFDLVPAEVKHIIQKKAQKSVGKLLWYCKVVKAMPITTKTGAVRCWSAVMKPVGTEIRVVVLKFSFEIPKRAKRKMDRFAEMHAHKMNCPKKAASSSMVPSSPSPPLPVNNEWL